jgi:hypothetical protein
MRVAICEWTTFPGSVEDELAAGELARCAVESMARL